MIGEHCSHRSLWRHDQVQVSRKIKPASDLLCSSSPMGTNGRSLSPKGLLPENHPRPPHLSPLLSHSCCLLCSRPSGCICSRTIVPNLFSVDSLQQNTSSSFAVGVGLVPPLIAGLISTRPSYGQRLCHLLLSKTSDSPLNCSCTELAAFYTPRAFKASIFDQKY